MTAPALLPSTIPCGFQAESARIPRLARARAPAIPYPSRTGTRTRLCACVSSALVPPIRTSRETARIVHMVKNDEHHVRLLARIVRSLLASEHFDSLADLTDALKFRCARLHVRWTNEDLNGAYRLIASNTPLPGLSALSALSRSSTHGSQSSEALSRAEAAAILERLGIPL